MREDMQRLEAILQLLDTDEAEVIRADLAADLVGVCARIEDVKQRVIYPALETHLADPAVMERARLEQAGVREALGEIRDRTHHVKPADVHLDDAAGFEAALDDLVRQIRAHQTFEDEALFPLLAVLDGGETEQLHSEVEKAVAHASSQPMPPQGLVARAAGAVVEKLDHLVDHDESAPWHPGIDKLDATLGTKTDSAPRR